MYMNRGGAGGLGWTETALSGTFLMPLSFMPENAPLLVTPGFNLNYLIASSYYRAKSIDDSDDLSTAELGDNMIVPEFFQTGHPEAPESFLDASR